MLRLLKTVLVATGLLAAAGCLNISWPWSSDRCCPPEVVYDVEGPVLEAGPVLAAPPPPAEGTMPPPRIAPQPLTQPEAQAEPYRPMNNKKK